MQKLYENVMEYSKIERHSELPAESFFKDAKKYAALVCQADETHFLVNGSGPGLLSAIFSATEQNGEIIAARNCQKTVYHAIELRQLKAHYVYPDILPEGIPGEVTTEMVAEMIKAHPEAKTLVFTSPTYEGVVSDVRGIVKLAHANGVTVIVDESHGGHFLKESGFPKSAVRLGADVVVQSTDKILPALVQTALLHVNKDYRHKEKVRKYLDMFQTSEPSSVLMASIDACLHWYMEEGREACKKYLSRLKKLRTVCETKLNHLKLITPKKSFDYDPSKIVISTEGCSLSGGELRKCLSKKYEIPVEMVSKDYVLLTIGIDDPEEFYGKLLEAFEEIDGTLEMSSLCGGEQTEFGKRKVLMRISEAVERKKKAIPLPESMGEVSASYIYVDPPGMPLLVPGEKISERCVTILQHYWDSGLKVQGLTKDQEIEVLWEEYFT